MRLCAALLFLSPLLAQQTVDLQVVDRIKSEAFDHSQVMDHLYYLTDVYGPRLTGSPEFRQAADWAMKRLEGYGVAQVHLEKWGPFGRSWTLQQDSVEMLEPRYSQLTAVPLAWSAPTNGPVTGPLVIAPLRFSFSQGIPKLEQDLAAYRAKWAGKLRGKIVLLNEPTPPAPQSAVQFHRLSESELAGLALAPEPQVKDRIKSLADVKWPDDPQKLRETMARLPIDLMDQVYDRYEALVAERGKFFAQEGAAAVIQEDSRAHDGMLFAESAGSVHAADPLAPPTFVVTAEQYDRIARLVERGGAVNLRLNLKAAISDRDVDGLNIIGEIPGGARKDEIVMIGAHFDSWHSGTGATDNGAGSAVMIEVMRILEALHLKLDRTVRIGLWGGEEQGLFGSRAYVKQHFGDPETRRWLPERARLSGYFNLDNGSGKIRGVYLQGNEAMRPVFQQYLAPFRDLGVTTITIRNTTGTDHLSFAAAGLPGFQFIQDPLDYGSITHHSDLDTYDHVVPADLMQAAAVIADLVYEVANRPDLLPRRELPQQ